MSKDCRPWGCYCSNTSCLQNVAARSILLRIPVVFVLCGVFLLVLSLKYIITYTRAPPGVHVTT